MQPVDVWGPYNNAMQNLGNTFANLSAQRDQQAQQRRLNGLQDLQAQSMRQGLMEKQAANQALIDTYGTGDRPDMPSQLSSAMAFQAQEAKMLAERELQQKEMNSFRDAVKDFKASGATPQFLTEFTKLGFSKNPELAKIAPFVNYADGKKITLVKDFKDNEIKDPLNPDKFLPAGRYEIEGELTYDPNKPFNFHSIKPANAWSEPYEEKIGGKKAMFQKNISTGERKRIGEDVSTTVRVGLNMPSSGEVETLAQMVAKGEMAPDQLPKRQGLFNQVINRAKEINPQFNARQASSDYMLSRNAPFRTRAMTAEVLPEIMQNMVEAGKKVNYPDARFAGVVKQWGLGQINDPDLTAYMTQRNDALMTIAGVMRANGMTDMAHKAEVEASNPTMSPRALDAWYAGQMKSLAPRLRQNRAIIGQQGQSTPETSQGKKPLSQY